MSSSKQSQRTPRPILVCGLDDGREKITRHYARLGRILGTSPFIYTRDERGFTPAAARRHDQPWGLVPRGKGADLVGFLRLALRLRPAHVELYHQSQSDLVHLGYCLIATALRIPIVTVCRGGELWNWEVHTPRRRAIYRFVFRRARMILLKEPHMEARLRALGLPHERAVFWHNHVPVHTPAPAPTATRRGVLFLNSFRSVRRPDIAVEVGLRLAARHPDVRFFVAGQRDQGEDLEVRRALEARVAEAGLTHRFVFDRFVPDPERFYQSACIFLLPAERVYLNYALLEAMERGLAPVISRAERAEEILEHGRDGLLVDTTAAAFTEAVDRLLSDPDELEAMARRARACVEERFELDRGLRELADVYARHVWRAGQ